MSAEAKQRSFKCGPRGSHRYFWSQMEPLYSRIVEQEELWLAHLKEPCPELIVRQRQTQWRGLLKHTAWCSARRLPIKQPWLSSIWPRIPQHKIRASLSKFSMSNQVWPNIRAWRQQQLETVSSAKRIPRQATFKAEMQINSYEMTYLWEKSQGSSRSRGRSSVSVAPNQHHRRKLKPKPKR